MNRTPATALRQLSTHRNIAIVIIFALLALLNISTAGAAHAASNGDTAVISADFDCTSVDVTSTKDLSNVVIKLADGTHIKFDNLSGHNRTFTSPSGQTIVAVWVKSGSNHSYDGPGYGELFESNTNCESPATEPQTETATNSNSTPDPDENDKADTSDNVDEKAIKSDKNDSNHDPKADDEADNNDAPHDVNNNADEKATKSDNSDKADDNSIPVEVSTMVMELQIVNDTPAVPVVEAAPAAVETAVLGLVHQAPEAQAPAAAAAALPTTGTNESVLLVTALAMLLAGAITIRRTDQRRNRSIVG